MTKFAVLFEMKCQKTNRVILLLAMLLCGTMVRGQDFAWIEDNNLVAEARVHAGAFWHHHFEMQKFNAHYPAIEVSLYQSTFGRNHWETVYHYPYIGVTFYHANFGLNFEQNPEVGKALGSVFALYPFINYPLNPNENSQVTFKLGAGLGFLTKCFDNFNNYQDFAIGSHVNAAVNLSFEYRQRISPRFMTVASFGLTHFSNGSTKLPNYGLNTFSSALGLAYYIRPPRENQTPAQRPKYRPFEFDRKHWFTVDLNYGIGFKNVSQTLGGDSTHYYNVHDLSTYLMVPITPYSSVGPGFSLALDLSDQTLPGYDTIDFKTYQLTRLNFNLCYVMTMERLSYYFEFGWHLKYNHIPLSKGNIYQKVTARYQLFDNIYAHLALMTHFGRADFLCFGLGYRFNQKYYLNHEKGTRHHPPGLH